MTTLTDKTASEPQGDFCLIIGEGYEKEIVAAELYKTLTDIRITIDSEINHIRSDFANGTFNPRNYDNAIRGLVEKIYDLQDESIKRQVSNLESKYGRKVK